MTTPPAQPSVDVDDIPEIIAEALSATGLLPTMDRLDALDKLLRTEITKLVPLAQRAADATELRSRRWYQLIQTAERAEDALAFQIGRAPLAGAIHVATLARSLSALREVLGAER